MNYLPTACRRQWTLSRVQICTSLQMFGAQSSMARGMGQQFIIRSPGDIPTDLNGDFPFMFTRSLEAAKRWTQKMSDPEDRVGILASSGGLRLGADGIEVSSGFRSNYPYTSWFLEPAGNVLFSNQLEVAATEFECQGLEIDWAILCSGR